MEDLYSVYPFADFNPTGKRGLEMGEGIKMLM
jgi:hypothetical protein